MLEKILEKCKELETEFTADFTGTVPADKLQQTIMEEVQDELSYPLLAKLKPEEQLQLAREYNALQNPSSMENLIILSLNTNNSRTSERKFNHLESAEIMEAFAKCADNITNSSAASAQFKYELARNIQSLVRCHSETARFALAVYEQNLSDIDIIDCVRTCMLRNNKLLDKGFAVIGKNVQNLLRDCPAAAKEQTKAQISEHLTVAFRDLYKFYTPRNAETIDIITDNFMALNKHIERNQQSSLGNTMIACRADYPLCKIKRDVLYYSFKAMEEDTRPFTEIYSEELSRHKDELAQAAHKEKVLRKLHKPQMSVTETVVMPNSLRYNLIHAGPEKPTAEKFRPITNGRKPLFGEMEFDKPSGGLWSSLALKIDGDIGQWEELCNRSYNSWLEHKHKGSWHIVPHDDCRILEFHKLSDIRPYLHNVKRPYQPCTDEEIMQGIDHFFDTGEREIIVDYKAISRDYDLFVIENQIPDHPLFGHLDCDSGIVMNFNKITVMNNKDYHDFITKETARFAKQLGMSEIDHTTLKQPENTDFNKRIMQAHFAAKKDLNNKE